MQPFRDGRPLKRWRYVGVFEEQLMACAALVQVGPARQAFWAVLTRGDGRIRERTRLLWRRGAVELAAGARRARATEHPEPERAHIGLTRTPRARASKESERQRASTADWDEAYRSGRVRVRDRGVELDLALEEDEGVQALCAHGRGQVWTRKQAGVPARGTISLDGGPARTIEALAIVDDTAGYHARHTEWRWAAGVGVTPDGTPLAFNLVAGVNDPPTGSERAVWIAGEPREAPPVEFSEDLASIACVDGSELRFAAEAERHRRESLVIVSSDYRAPFGVFSGTLPGGVELAHGLGVAEHHRAKW
ncbi:MAG TPA: DUF2804 family protein [Solirubrobacteraceae bacterium]